MIQRKGMTAWTPHFRTDRVGIVFIGPALFDTPPEFKFQESTEIAAENKRSQYTDPLFTHCLYEDVSMLF